jgi:hypothetical protein
MGVKSILDFYYEGAAFQSRPTREPREWLPYEKIITVKLFIKHYTGENDD